jgi:hypothetical protein
MEIQGCPEQAFYSGVTMHLYVHVSSQIHVFPFSFVPAEILVVYLQMGNGRFIKHSFLLILYNNILFDVVKYMLLKEVHLTTEEAAHLYRV